MKPLLKVTFFVLYFVCITSVFFSGLIIIDIIPGRLMDILISICVFVIFLYLGGWLLLRIDTHIVPLEQLGFFGMIMNPLFKHFYISIKYLVSKNRGYKSGYYKFRKEITDKFSE
ncbi:hypothetical protein [Thermoactinomyces sp. DSM 45892]|uniref:hypothetical protein n=1 Tax=Thermoactinomyces sp. DSM 45892 TaxID=1882753 RepID=UPI000898220C|nr:hypothetical protein [Thermoactinomyces sp. DSM 45892]SDZ33890.1 hypothetical protein SAMN05444416_1234 [Thermoactinomyces sp. DSM 45892]